MKNSIVKTLAALAALILTALPLSAAEVVTYYHNDHLGSPIAATDSTGTVVWQQAYDPWGEPVTTTANNRAYNGKWRDLETGLNDYAARWQSSSIGRFTQIDNAPWHEGNIHSFNRYAYANNSPYRYKDPDGNIPVDTIWDAANVLYDGARIIYGHATGNSGVVAEASTDMAVDLGAMFIPYVPAGSSKLARMGDGAETVKKSGPKLLSSPRQQLLGSATDPKLKNRIDKLYRANAKVGSGSTADAIRHELKTGELLSPKGHVQKGIEMRNGLMKDLKSGRLNETDTKIARRLVKDLQSALSGQ